MVGDRNVETPNVSSTCAISVQYGSREIGNAATKHRACGSGRGYAQAGWNDHAVQVLLKLSLISAIDFTSEQTLRVVPSHAPNGSVSVRVEQ